MEKIKGFLSNMTKQQKIIAAVVAAVIVIALVVGAVFLFGGDSGAGNEGGNTGGTKTYTIEVKTEGGKVFEDLEVHVFVDSTQADLVAVGKPDENGTYSFEAEASDKYVAVLKNVPVGYPIEEYYTLTSETLSLTLKAQLLSADDVSSALKLGGVAADMTVTTADGTTYTISELLKEKKAVVLNFWYEGCEPCRAEFPYLEEAYKQYSDKLEILAVNTYDGDDATVAAYKADMGLTFPMAKADEKFATIYNVAAYPTTVVIDRYGTIGFMHTGSVPSTDSFAQLFEYFTSDSYVQSTVRNLDDIVVKVEGGDGTQANPFLKYETEYEVEVAAGAEVYYQMFKVDGMILEIADPNAYVIYGEDKYEAVDGKVSLILSTPDTYTPAVFVIGNTSAETKKFNVTLSFVEGSSGKPFVMNLGDFNVNIAAGKASGVYYTYTATENGTLTLNCTGVTEGVKYDFSLYNTVSSALRNMSSNEDGSTAVSITANAGDEIQISIGALPNDDNQIPAADFTFNASYEAGEGTGIDPNATIDYKVTLVDQKGNPIANASVKICSDNVENVVGTITTDASGVATMNLPGGNYIAVVTAPSGYKADTTEYIMTKYNHELSITLEKTTIVTKTYTVKVVDESGKAISGAGVTVDGTYVKTDANGLASFTLEESTYTASVAASGYENASKSFGGSTDITVTLKKETTPAKEVTYTVEVYRILNNKESALKNVKVQFKSGSTVVAEVTTDDKGNATAKLKEGNYTAVVSDDTYGSSEVSLTAKNNSVSVMAAKSIDMSATTEVCEEQVVTIKTGGSHLVINKNGDTYFMFVPTKSGKYSVSVTGEGAKVTYCGGVNYLSTPSYESNEHVINVDESQAENEIAYVFSVTGVSETVVMIKRTGDAEEVADIPDYVGTCGNPSKFTLTEDGSKLTYFDPSETASVTLVKDENGFYHYGSKTGPMVYINLDGGGYISINAVVNSQGFKNVELNEAYNALMIKYTGMKDTMGNVISASCLDSTYGVYPLNDDLIHMVKYGGQQMGWWTKGEPNYLFGSKNVDAETAWLSLCCYVK